HDLALMPYRRLGDCVSELVAVLDLDVVELEDDVTHLDVALVSGPSCNHVDDDDAVRALAAVLLGQVSIQRLELNAQKPTSYPAYLA
ncbi:MAG: hypothetical protein QF473_10530, partial [Planctomycetota bacterium]|nr:hypothetical protein [Planctomycetota bacterium]